MLTETGQSRLLGIVENGPQIMVWPQWKIQQKSEVTKRLNTTAKANPCTYCNSVYSAISAYQPTNNQL